MKKILVSTNDKRFITEFISRLDCSSGKEEFVARMGYWELLLHDEDHVTMTAIIDQNNTNGDYATGTLEIQEPNAYNKVVSLLVKKVYYQVYNKKNILRKRYSTNKLHL